jgi:hypothetical protein
LKQMISAYRTAFPDLKMTLDDIARDALRAEGDGVRCWCSGPLL